MAESPVDIDKLGLDELKTLLVQAFTRISALEKENQQLRDEVARLKGLKGKSEIKPRVWRKTPSRAQAKRGAGKATRNAAAARRTTNSNPMRQKSPRPTMFLQDLFATAIQKLHAQKDDMLRVLDHPENPLHTNSSENDIRYEVTKRKISGGTAPTPAVNIAIPFRR